MDKLWDRLCQAVRRTGGCACIHYLAFHQLRARDGLPLYFRQSLLLPCAPPVIAPLRRAVGHIAAAAAGAASAGWRRGRGGLAGHASGHQGGGLSVGGSFQSLVPSADQHFLNLPARRPVIWICCIRFAVLHHRVHCVRLQPMGVRLG